jgi:mannose-6-phosphate isomerase-like protein (cupin superfamily)
MATWVLRQGVATDVTSEVLHMIKRLKGIEPIQFEGLSIFDYTAGSNGSSSFAVVEVPVGGSHRLARSKRSDKRYFVAEGEFHFRIGDQQESLTKGDYCLIQAGIPFSYRNTGGQPGQLVLVHTPSFRMEDEESLEG